MKQWGLAAGMGIAMLMALPAFGADKVVQMNLVSEQGVGKNIGTITISSGPNGLVFTPQLAGLAPGVHGFHVHQNADCSVAMKEGKPTAALAAGGHYDPVGTGKHEGPLGKGHLGDLPALVVNADGTAVTPVVAPRLKMPEMTGRSLMIHGGGDNYSDQPAPLGGGGPRVACGVVN